MKRRFYALMLVVAMVAMTLVGCGSDTTDTTNTTNETEVNTEVEENTGDVVEEPTTEPEVEVPEVEEPVVEPEEVVDGENDLPKYTYSNTWGFPEGIEGFTDKFLNEDYPEWSVNETHYVAANGNEMNFSWEGPAALGEQANAGETTLFLYGDNENYELRAFTTGPLSPETYDEIKEYDKETIISFASNDAPYVLDGYYNANIGDTYMSFTYAILGDISGETYMGYEHYIMDREKGLCYQFSYLENANIYDDTRAMNVVNSLDFWDYVPVETTIE